MKDQVVDKGRQVVAISREASSRVKNSVVETASGNEMCLIERR